MQKAMIDTKNLKWKKSESYNHIAIKDNYVYKYPTLKGITTLNAWFVSPENAKKQYTPVREPNEKEINEVINFKENIHEETLLYSPGRSAHWLKAFELQYKKLKYLFGESIPYCEFGYSTVGTTSKKLTPILKQDYIQGITLCDMLSIKKGRSESTQNAKIKPKYLNKLPLIIKQLEKFLDSTEIDFNIENFVFSENTQTLFYIDNEPPFLVPADMNQSNLNSIKKYIINNFNPPIFKINSQIL